MPRINLENVPARKSMDAEWSKGRKIMVGAAAGVICVGAIGAGIWAYVASQPPGLPRNAEDALATIQSAKFDRLDNDRKDQILAESRRLLADLSWEERRDVLGDRDAQRALMEASMDEAARRMARGEDMGEIMASMWGGRGRGGPRGEGGERPELTEEQRRERAAEWEKRRQERENMSEEERRAAENERRQAMTDRFENQLSSGNAQNSGLRGEFFKRMSAWRDAGGGGGFRGRGGGGGGGRGGGG